MHGFSVGIHSFSLSIVVHRPARALRCGVRHGRLRVGCAAFRVYPVLAVGSLWICCTVQASQANNCNQRQTVGKQNGHATPGGEEGIFEAGHSVADGTQGEIYSRAGCTMCTMLFRTAYSTRSLTE